MKNKRLTGVEELEKHSMKTIQISENIGENWHRKR